jgi:eukaryotic-like serine/threonine-protein kinase
VTGRAISHYEILQQLGEGGMGVVSLARDTRLGRQVAVKILRHEAVQRPGRRERFIQEARAASALNHPNIVTIYDIQSVDGVDLIAMEYIPGQSLDEVIGRKGLPVTQALKYAIQITSALEAAHSAGIIHRDLKPGNVMITETGRVKVLDFGLAKLMESEAADGSTSFSTAEFSGPYTAEGVILGTAAYMSPEQASGKKVDARTDVFSFGAVLYEMLAGQRPFDGETGIETITSILKDEPKPLREVAPEIPREIERVVMRCLRKDPGRRFQDMADLRVTLEEVREEFDSGTLSAEQTAVSHRSNRALTRAVLAFALVVLAGVAFTWWKFLNPAPEQMPVLTRLTTDVGLTGFPAISPDGNLFAFASDRADGTNLDLYVQQVAGGDPIRLTSDPVDEYEPVFSPDGSRIAYRSEKDGGGIYIVSALGGESRQVARSGRSPAFSPDGRQLVYAVGSPGVGAAFAFGASSLYIAPVNGGEPRRIVEDFAVAHHPVWTQDGQHILFLGTRQLGPPNYDWWVVPVAGGAPVSSGALAHFRQQRFRVGPYPFALQGSSVIFSMGRGDTINLWRVALDPSDNWRPRGEPKQLTFGTGQEIQPSTARNGRLVFAGSNSNTDVYLLPLDMNAGRVTGSLRQLTRDAGDDYYPDMAADGSRIAFISGRTGTDDVWMLDPLTGRRTASASSPGRELHPRLSADGSILAYSSIEDNKRKVMLLPPKADLPTMLCEDCGILRDLSPDGSQILLQSGPPPHISLLDVATRQVTEIYRHSQYPLYAPRFSPDMKWVTFQMVDRPAARTLVIAPHRGARAVPETEWIPVSDGTAMDRNPVWSPGGNLLYFLSERDSFRCLWAQRIHPQTRKPVGDPFAVEHFHNAMRNLMNIDGPGQVNISPGPDSIVFAMGELTGNIWLAEP